MISSTVSRVHHQTILPWGSHCLKHGKRTAAAVNQQRNKGQLPRHIKKTEHFNKTKRFIIQIKQILQLKAIFNLVF